MTPHAPAGAEPPSGPTGIPRSPRALQPADDAGFLDAVLDSLVDGVVACSRTGVPILVNDAARALYEAATGRHWDEHAGRDWLAEALSTRSREDPLATWRGPLQIALDGMSVRDVEIRVGPPDAPRILVVSGQPLAGADASQRGAVLTLHDVTKERLAESLLATDGAHDRRTGLPRRRSVVEHLGAALHGVPAGDVAVLAVEIERYDATAERFGFDVADAVIAFAGRAVAAELVPEDLLGHLDDSRFVVVVSHRAADRAEELAARIARAVSGPRPVPARTADSGAADVHVTARVGVAFAEEGETAETLLHAAQLATSDALDQGKHVVRFQRGGHDGVLEHALSKALDNGELLLHYQPKVELESRRTVGVEALVRWERPGHGLVGPDRFIPVAEASGLIVDLGAWVLREACLEAEAWLAIRGALAPLRISVNVSPRQFDAGVTEVVQQALAASGLPAGLLCVEVTESVVMRDVDSAIETLNELRELGVTVSLDDFGTGYSSLAYLRRFPVNELKIDRSFVSGLGEEATNTALVGGIVSVAHALDLDAVAEGVETEEQMVALATVGCDLAQGYYISRPLPAVGVRGFVCSEFVEPAWTEGGHKPSRRTDDTVLVADDADDVRLLARMTLTTSGFEVHEARDGTTALGLAKSLKPAIVVLDVQMPGMDGLTLCRALRDDPETADCTIVVLTATSDATDKISAYTAGADDYIVKPFSPRELVSRVRAAHRRRAEPERILP